MCNVLLVIKYYVYFSPCPVHTILYLQYTVIRFFFVVKIFSYRANVRKFFTRILFYNEKFSDEYLGQVRTYVYVVMTQWLARETSARSLGWRLLLVTVQRIEPPLRKNREHTFEIFLSKCPMIVSCFSTATAYLSAMLVGSLPHTSSSPIAAAHISLYTW